MKDSTATKKGRTTADEMSDEDLLPVTWPIDTAVEISRRPMTGPDINRWRGRHNLLTVDAIYALSIQNSAKYNEMLRREYLPYSLELLIRLYDEHPGHAPWASVPPKAAFEMLYGDVMRKFEGTEFAKETRLALYRRFTGAVGRSVYTAYRWIEAGGNAKAQLRKVFDKLFSVQDPRQTLENLARLMYRARREDFDKMFPLPTVENPPQPKRRGPAPGARARAREAAATHADEVVEAVAATPKRVKQAAPRKAPAKKPVKAVAKKGLKRRKPSAASLAGA